MLKRVLDFYKKLSKRERIAALIAAAVIFVLAADRFVVQSFAGRLVSLNRQISEEESAVRRSLHVLVQKERIRAEGKEYMAFSVEAKDPEEEMVNMLKELESMAMQSSVTLLNLKPASSTQTGSTKKYSASFECEAQMEQIAAFFHAIESSTKLFQIEKYNIQPKSKESSIAHCSITVSKSVLS